MKNIIYILIVIFALAACSEDASEYIAQANELKKANEAKEKEVQAAKNILEEQKKESERLKTKLDSLERAINAVVPDPELLTMEFLTSDNSSLSKNVECYVHSNGIVDCWLPNLNGSKNLVPRFTFNGTMLTLGNTEVVSGSTQIDFSQPVTLSVRTSKDTKDYIVYVYSYTGLPVMRIDTEDGQAITSKKDYLNAHMVLTEDVRTRGANDVLEADLQIKGRGNSTWDRRDWPKKPYRLKFNDKVSLLGEHKDKSWVLLSNYPDKSMLHTHIAFYMGKISNLDYTSSSHFVDLILNGDYLGTYQVCEKLKVSNHRVAVDDDGFLLEVDARAKDEEDASIFWTSHLTNPINIKEPLTAVGDANYGYIRDFIYLAENVLYSRDFLTPEGGWKDYFDLDSFVDWYLINEIAHNPDATMLYSCFMSLKRGEKLKMGPIWDFDLAFGNTDYWERGPEGFWIKNTNWISRMFQDPAFVERVKERYNYFYSRKGDIFREISAAGSYLKHSAAENENVWHTLYEYTVPNVDIWGSYHNEVQSLKEWLNVRMDWLKKEFDKM
jgi:hypothetical protein